jgi:hypothetical protein
MVIISTHFHVLEIMVVHVRVEVLTAVAMKITIFWDLMACSLIDLYCHFKGICCHHHLDIKGNLLSSKMESPCFFGIVVKDLPDSVSSQTLL